MLLQERYGGQTPFGPELSLGEDCYSDLLREISDYLGVYTVYGKTGDILQRLLGLKLSTRVVEENMAEDAVDVEAYYEQKPVPSPADEAEILVVQADGKGVPLVLETPVERKVRLGKGEKRGRKKEAIVTTAYTITGNPRTAEDVVPASTIRKSRVTAKDITEPLLVDRCRPTRAAPDLAIGSDFDCSKPEKVTNGNGHTPDPPSR